MSETYINLETKLYFERLTREYIKIWPIMLKALEMYACESPKEQKWFFHYLCAYGPVEFGVDFVELCDTLAEDTRKGLVELNSQQFREILKCERIILKVHDLFYELDERLNTTAEEICTRLVDDPLWKELSEQARKTLQFLRK